MIQKYTYTTNPFCPARLKTIEVKAGGLGIGGDNPVRLQSMINISTMDTEACVAQAERIIKAGGELVRFAVINNKEVENLAHIKSILRSKGYQTPLIADTHFNAGIAVRVAVIVEKVRINPGNFLLRKKESYSDEEYEHELRETEEKLRPLIEACKRHHTALRIGSNHGSLSSRIIFRYGDTPKGMVQAAMEYVEICERHHFDQLVLSMKSSNTRVMIQAYRLLVHELLKKNKIYPLHLGVTEAGAAEDGRIKSAVGIGSLLLDGLGDTIRVSLTEDPEYEIPVAKKLKALSPQGQGATPLKFDNLPYHPFEFKRRNSRNNQIAGLKKRPIILGNDDTYEYYIKDGKVFSSQGNDTDIVVSRISSVEDIKKISFISNNNHIILLEGTSLGAARQVIKSLNKVSLYAPLILKMADNNPDEDSFMVEMAAKAGIFLIDGLADGIMIENNALPSDRLVEIAQNILQAARARIYKTEFISCPGCGRTLFDLQTTSSKIRAALSHLKGLKIGIMGCIVNGPGEMADADYGYVGAAAGKITLYKNKKIVKKNIPENQALNELIQLIKRNGDWVAANKISSKK